MKSEERVPQPPTGFGHVRWLGPGILWMVSAAGSGELLFTPRVGSLYGYALLWALILAVTLKWFINREVGRYTVCTGETILKGFTRLGGRWPLWLILVPQLFVAVATVAGLGGTGATALVLLLPGGLNLWMIVAVVLAGCLTFWGKYQGIEKIAAVLAFLLATASMAAAVSVWPGAGALAAGLAPHYPEKADIKEILPWLGFALSGAAGLIWYSYWVEAKGYGAASVKGDARFEGGRLRVAPDDEQRLRGWLRQLLVDNTFAVVSTFLITVAFLILGVQLLKPKGLVPEEDKAAGVLGQLLGEVWGPVGFWVMVGGVCIGLWQTVLSGQDGFGRMFSDGTRLLFAGRGLQGRWADGERLRRAFIVVLVTLLPIALFLVQGKPVGLLKIAGAIEAAHIPVVAALTLYLNRRVLPESLRPNGISMLGTVLAAVFFLFFAGLYLFQLLM